jgi:hypothetical protein
MRPPEGSLMEIARKTCSVFAIAVLLAAASCQHLENPGKVYPQSPKVHETRSIEIERDMARDIPVPRDMILETAGNVSYYQEKARVGRWRLKGYVSMEDVAVFYRERMPERPYGWTLVNEQARGSATTMSFQKGSERAEVTIQPEDSATVAVIILNNQTN